MKERYQWIDIAKGIGILLVVVGHATSIYMDKGMYLKSILYRNLYQYIYSFHMPMFIMISGLLSGRKSIESKRYEIKRNIVAYGIPYIVFSLGWGITKILLSRFVVHETRVKDLFLIPFYPIVPYWYLYALLLMNVLQVFVNHNKNDKKFRYFHLLMALSGYIVCTYVTEMYSWLKGSIIERFLSLYIFYVIGVYSGDFFLGIRVEKSKMMKAIIPIMVGSVWFIACKSKELFAYEVLSLNFSIAILGTVFVLLLSLSMNNNAFLEYLGRMTLPIYLLHTPSMLVMQTLINVTGIEDVNGVISLLILTFFGVFFSLLIYYVGKKVMILQLAE